MKLFLEILVKGNKRISDEKLIQALKAGSTKAYEMIYLRYKQPIFSYIINMVHNRTIGEELTQEVFLKIYKNINQYSTSFKFSTWLWAIARNTTLDHLKNKDALNFTNDIKYNDSDDNSSIENIVVDLNNAEQDLIKQNDLNTIKYCLQKLSAEKRDILNMRLFADLSYQEIADLHAKNLGAIKSIILRAKIEIKACLTKELNHDQIR